MSAQHRGRYYLALHTLANMKPQWRWNFNKYANWDGETQDWWIKRIEQQAREDLPMAVELVAEVIKLRMLE